MGRPISNGARYFPLDVDFASDPKVKTLRARHGAEGVMCYIYLLCAVFREGYAIKYDDDLVCALSLDVGVPEEKVKDLVAFFADRGLVDADVLGKYNVLTSRGIQKRFQEIVRSRASKRTISVVENLWILCGQETEKFISIIPRNCYSENNYSFSEINGSFSENNPSFSEINAQIKENKIKENKIKENESDMPLTADSPHMNGNDRKGYGSYGNVWLNDTEYEKLHEMYSDADARIERLGEYMMTSGRRYASHYATIVSWAKEDAAKQSSSSSFDTDEFFEAALRRAQEQINLSNGGNNE